MCGYELSKRSELKSCTFLLNFIVLLADCLLQRLVHWCQNSGAALRIKYLNMKELSCPHNPVTNQPAGAATWGSLSHAYVTAWICQNHGTTGCAWSPPQEPHYTLHVPCGTANELPCPVPDDIPEWCWGIHRNLWWYDLSVWLAQGLVTLDSSSADQGSPAVLEQFGLTSKGHCRCFLDLTVEEGDQSFVFTQRLLDLYRWWLRHDPKKPKKLVEQVALEYFIAWFMAMAAETTLPFGKKTARCVGGQKRKNLGMSQVCAQPNSSRTFSNLSFSLIPSVPENSWSPKIWIEAPVNSVAGVEASCLAVLKRRWTDCSRSLQSHGPPQSRGDIVSIGQYSRGFISWYGGFRMCTDPDSPKPDLRCELG